MAGLEGLLTGHTLVKRYTIEDVIGRGGFAVVYRATDNRLNRPVAVKVITLSASGPSSREQLRERLHREAQSAASLPHHPNLVTVHDVGTDPELGLDFLVMELLRGENLAQYLAAHGPPPLEQAICIIRDAAEGLAVGHRAGLVHRDVKPGNLFLAEPHDASESFRVCLLDYGIAQAIEDDQTVTRGAASVPLSPAYASPEQLGGGAHLSSASDVFSLGVVAYQVLTGERPFATAAGKAPEGWALRSPLRALDPRIPPAVEQVIHQAMSIDPALRHPDGDAFVQALNAAVAAEDPPAPVVVPPAAEDDRTVLAAPVRPVPPPSVSTPVPPARRSGKGWMIGLLAALLLGAAAMWALVSRGGSPAQAADASRDEPAPVSTPATEVREDDAGAEGTVPAVSVEERDDAPPASSGSGGTTVRTETGTVTETAPATPRTPSPVTTAPAAPPSAPPADTVPQQPPVSTPPPPEVEIAHPPADPQPRPQPPEPQPVPPPAVVIPTPPTAPRDTIRIGGPPA